MCYIGNVMESGFVGGTMGLHDQWAVLRPITEPTMAMNRPMNLKYMRWSGLTEEAGLICKL